MKRDMLINIICIHACYLSMQNVCLTVWILIWNGTCRDVFISATAQMCCHNFYTREQLLSLQARKLNTFPRIWGGGGGLCPRLSVWSKEALQFFFLQQIPSPAVISDFFSLGDKYSLFYSHFYFYISFLKFLSKTF